MKAGDVDSAGAQVLAVIHTLRKLRLPAEGDLARARETAPFLCAGIIGYQALCLLRLTSEIPLHTHTEEFPLESANEALQRLKPDQTNGAAVLRVS